MTNVLAGRNSPSNPLLRPANIEKKRNWPCGKMIFFQKIKGKAYII